MSTPEYTDAENCRELQRRAARVINEWHADDLSADAVSHMADLIPDELVPWRSEPDDAPPVCAVCGGTLELSVAYPEAGLLHANDADDADGHRPDPITS